MNLSAEQFKQIGEIEEETKARLDKILTPEQMKALETARPPMPGGPGQRPMQDGPPSRR